MSDLTDVYRDLIRGEVFAEVGVELAKATNGDVTLAEATLSGIRDDIAMLKAEKVKAPTGLAAVRADALAELRAEYEQHVAWAEDRLGQSETVQAVMRIDVKAEQRRLKVAQAWIAAIDTVGSA